MLLSHVGYGWACADHEYKAEPIEVLEDIPLEEGNPEKFTKIGTSMKEKTKQDLVQFLRKSNVFA